MTAVVNVRRVRGAQRTGDVVYIGRNGQGKVGPVGSRGQFGNPWGRVPLIHFEGSFLKRVGEDLDFRAAVEALRGKRLACFCAGPEGLEPAWASEGARCHGQIIAAYVDGRRRP